MPCLFHWARHLLSNALKKWGVYFQVSSVGFCTRNSKLKTRHSKLAKILRGLFFPTQILIHHIQHATNRHPQPIGTSVHFVADFVNRFFEHIRP